MGHINPLVGAPMYAWGEFIEFTRRFPDASKFPPTGLAGSKYLDLATNIEYFWDVTQKRYVARWMTESYSTKSTFPSIGRIGTEYIDESTHINYYWSPSRNEYVAKLTTEVYLYRSNFPTVGIAGIMYIAQSTHIEYFWDSVRNQYVAKLATEAYANKGQFPAAGKFGIEYTDLSTSIKYMWDSGISDYTTDVTVALGTMFTFTGTTAPAGYFVMDGRSFDTTKYNTLHNWLVANWNGYSNGFIPDMQNVTVRGKNSSRQVGSYESDAMQDHEHNANAQITSMHFSISNTEVVGDTPGLYDGNGNKGHYDGDLGFVSAGINVGVQGMKSGSIADETRMKNKAVVFIIKATMRVPL